MKTVRLITTVSLLLSCSVDLVTAQGILNLSDGDGAPAEVSEEARFQDPWVPKHLWCGDVALLFGGTVIDPRFDFMALAGLSSGGTNFGGGIGGGQTGIGANTGSLGTGLNAFGNTGSFGSLGTGLSSGLRGNPGNAFGQTGQRSSVPLR